MAGRSQRRLERTCNVPLPHRSIDDQLAGEHAETLEIFLLLLKHRQATVETHLLAILSLEGDVVGDRGQTVWEDRQLLLGSGEIRSSEYRRGRPRVCATQHTYVCRTTSKPGWRRCGRYPWYSRHRRSRGASRHHGIPASRLGRLQRLGSAPPTQAHVRRHRCKQGHPRIPEQGRSGTSRSAVHCRLVLSKTARDVTPNYANCRRAQPPIAEDSCGVADLESAGHCASAQTPTEVSP